MSRTPDRIWWTARELAEAALPDLPATKRGVTKVAERLGWAGHPDLARRRAGRGGGVEYHWTLLPMATQKALLAQASGPDRDGKARRMDRDAAWCWYDSLPEGPKSRAGARLSAIQQVEALEAGGLSRYLAIAEVARMEGVGDRTIWGWFELIEGIAPSDRLAYLAPRHRVSRARRGERKDCTPEWWDFLKADYLRLGEPSFTSCYRRAARVAETEGWQVLPERTARRRLNEEVPPVSQVLARKGLEAMKRLYPAQTRDKTAMQAMEAVNADFHKFDVFVRWPVGGRGEVEIVRPQMVAFQDIYSGRILSWRLDRTPNKTAVQLALGDMVEAYGIPDHVLLDNGREFANKFLTGQAPTRHRFKVKDDDIPGLLVSLGCTIHWATPYSGQSKPIERAFRDLCDSIAKDPRFHGAYTGNRPDAKPENYGARAIDLDRFLAVLAEGIEEHNARRGRRSETALGRSFLETFDASYAVAPIRKATTEQRRLWLLGAEGVRADKDNGEVRFMGNRYWAAWAIEMAGSKVVARFDPEDLRAGVHVYALTGAYLGHLPCIEAVGFFDLEEARVHARARRDWQKAERAALEAHRRLSVTEISDHLDRAAPQVPQAPVAAKVVRPVFSRPAKTAAPPPPDPALEAAQAALVADLSEARAARPRAGEDEPRARFRRALGIEAQLKAGQAVARDEERWLESYRTQPEYRSQMRLYEDFGDGMLG